MGNHNSIAINDKKQSKRKPIINKKSKISEEFIINLHRKQMINGITCNSCDRRRVVFISLIGLYQTWYLCPTPVLYSSIFMLPLKKKWIYSPITYKHEMEQTILGRISIFKDSIAFEEFLMLLKWKDSQNLAFWMLDEYEMDEMDEINENDLISPCWRNFSRRLTNLYDAVTKSTYKPIKFDTKWWKYCYNKLFKSRYNVATCNILSELSLVTMRFKSIQEILYQSNPHSLNPIVSYLDASHTTNININDHQLQSSSNINCFVSQEEGKMKDYYGFVSFEHGCCPDIDDDDDDDDQVHSDNEGIWIISTDYNEYDLQGLDVDII